MNKTQLIDAVSESAGLTKAAAAKAVDAVVSTITRSLKAGNQVTIVGFGTFLVRERSARMGRNPRTGETISIEASKAPAFKPGKALKGELN